MLHKADREASNQWFNCCTLLLKSSSWKVWIDMTEIKASDGSSPCFSLSLTAKDLAVLGLAMDTKYESYPMRTNQRMSVKVNSMPVELVLLQGDRGTQYTSELYRKSYQMIWHCLKAWTVPAADAMIMPDAKAWARQRGITLWSSRSHLTTVEQLKTLSSEILHQLLE